MAEDGEVISATRAEREREGFDEPARGSASWFTFFSSDRTPTTGMSAGVMELEPDGELVRHRHAQPEIYFVAEGHGMVSVDGAERRLDPGTAVYIPGHAEHGLHNTGEATLRVFYVFPTDSFAEIVYRF